MAAPLLLDTNLLLLLAVGLTSDRYIAKHKRLQAFDRQDFKIVEGLIADSSGLVLCPNVITETSNLIRYLNNPLQEEVAERFRSIVCTLGEVYVESATAVNESSYHRLGVADVVLLVIARSNVSLVTDDLALYLAASKEGLNVINYNHIRESRPDFK